LALSVPLSRFTPRVGGGSAFMLGDIAHMTIDDIAQKAFDRRFDKAEAEAFCQQEHITPNVFMERFARYIVDGYLDGRFTWVSCDNAMNGSQWFMHTKRTPQTPDYPFEVFLAFDAGEMKHPNMTPDQVTRQFIDKIVAKYHVA
jgi:hypothetical protein